MLHHFFSNIPFQRETLGRSTLPKKTLIMAGLIDTIGIVASVLSIVTFFEDLFPDTPTIASNVPAGLTTIRIGAAKDGPAPSGGTLREGKGRIGQINMYNENMDKISSDSYYHKNDPSGLIPDGSFLDFNVDCQGQQPTYVQLFGHEDAVCIAYIMHTWPDGTKRGWSGDIGALCGVSHWSYSNIIVGKTAAGKNYKPACTWLDWDHNTGIELAALQIHMSEFFPEDATNSTSLDKQTFCNAPTMIWQNGHPSPDDGIWDTSYDARWNGQTGQGKQRRAIRKRSLWMEAQLIVSKDSAHSATQLCQSETSHSSDFVSLNEGLFCDMSTKIVWPLCSESTLDDCFDQGDKALVVRGERLQRHYQDVQSWE